MAVAKFRDVADMQAALWRQPVDDPARQLAQVLAFWRRVSPGRPAPAGVQRFRTIDEANREREARERAPALDILTPLVYSETRYDEPDENACRPRPTLVALLVPYPEQVRPLVIPSL